MGEWKKTMLETGIDDFLELVATRGAVKAADVADELSLAQETVESWAEILSKEGLISTEYDRKGNLVITNKTKNTKEKETHLKELTKNVQADIINVVANVHAKEEKLKEEEKTLKDFEKILKKDLDESLRLEHEFDKIKAREKEIRDLFDSVETRERTLRKETSDIKKIVDCKIKGINSIEKELQEFDKKKKKLLEDIELIKKISKVLNVPAKEIDKKVEDVEEKVLEIRKLNNKLNKKYGLVKKIFSKF